METKKYTQFGTLSLAIMLPLLLLFSGFLIKSGLEGTPDFYVHLILVIVFLMCLLVFYKLTIIVDDKFVSFKLGIGVVTKSYKIAHLKSCQPIATSGLEGIGIRMLPNGWLYTVTGLKAIELRFTNKNSVIQIGTNKPDEISQLVESLMGDKVSANQS